jgi:crotonobetainyl-CoA:carnitine CoA-transferase CaiB-like acyl-CoA transferase
MVVDIDHSKLGRVKTFNLPIKFSSSEMGIGRAENPADPELGQNTAEVLGQILGLGDEEIGQLRRRKIVWS